MEVKKGFRIQMGLVLLTVICIMIPAVSSADEPFHLGVVLGLSGTGAVSSRNCLTGVELAVEEINKQGGFLGKHPIKLFGKGRSYKA